MKPVRDWTVEDLLQLPPGEQDWFERKGKKALDLTASGVDENHVRSELSTTLSAMANTGGGQIVFGLTNVGGIDNGGISRKVRHGTKAWLEDVIPHSVEPPLHGFAVFEVADSPGVPPRLGAENALYLVDVPDSENAPTKLETRGTTGEWEGSHVPWGIAFILDILNRRKYPLVEPSLSTDRSKDTSEGRAVYALRTRLTNRGRFGARDYLLQLKVPD